MRQRSLLREPVRRKGFGVSLGPRILRLGGSDPFPPLWGGARRARLQAQGSSPSRPISTPHKLSQLPHQLSATPLLQRAPPGRALERRARPGRGLLQSPAEPECSGPRLVSARSLRSRRARGRPGRSPPCVWAPPGWGVAEAWASRGPASVCFWPRCSFCSGHRPVSRKGGDRNRIWSAGSSEVPKDGVESGMGGVRGGRECCAWRGCCVSERVSDSGRFVGVTAEGRRETCDRVLLVDALE